MKIFFRYSGVGQIGSVGFGLLCWGSLAHAAGGGVVVGGQATISTELGSTTINQDSSRAVINWSNFNIVPNESVTFHQPGADSATLNRVVGTGQTTIDGILSANGRVFIVNPSGVVFGKGASVDVGALTATTLGTSRCIQSTSVAFINKPYT